MGPLPERAAAALERIGVGTDVTAAVFAGDRALCLEQARLIKAADVDPGRTMFLVTGPEGDDAARLRDVLASTGARVVTEPDASRIADALEVSDPPLAFHVSKGRIVARSRLGPGGDFGRFSRQIRQWLKTEQPA
ncbi:hypothetical protein [Nonomuraea sp. NPDC050643]|uniref:hypothetical protein n=1 Tax=Nonomuraea sp. NPDC050643 TaxID=3155660 RepID=UPI0033C95535